MSGGLQLSVYIPTFGNGAPGGTVSKLNPYYDTSTNPYTPYIYNAGAWHKFGAPGAGGNATEIQGVNVDATAPNDGQILIYSAADTAYVPTDAPAGGLPTIVQSAVSGVSIASGVLLGTQPVEGNLLIAIVMDSGSSQINGSGWTQLHSENASGDGFGYGYKIAGASESTTQEPTTDGNSGIVAVWEISDATPGLWTVNKDQNALTVGVVNYQTYVANQLVIGAIDRENTGVGAPISVTGMDHHTVITGGGRGGLIFDFSPATVGLQTSEATYAGSLFTCSAVIIIG